MAELAGGMARKTESIVQNVLPLAMSFLTLVDDEDDWENSVRGRHFIHRALAQRLCEL